MGLIEKMVKQARKPTGMFGRLIARGMNYGSHRKLAEWGLKHASINKDDTILDVGCGGGKTVNTMAKIATEGKVYGIDYSKVSVSVASKINKKFIEVGRAEIIHASAESLPFPDNFFDLATAIEVYPFWPDLINTLREIRRVLKPGGSIVLLSEGYRDKKFEKRNEKWAKFLDLPFYLPEEFREFLREAGYSSIQIDVLEDKNWIAVIGTKGGKL